MNPADHEADHWPIPQSVIDQHEELTRQAAEGAAAFNDGEQVGSAFAWTKLCRGCGVDLSRSGHAPECENLPEPETY